jgi:hypothetical protein
VLNCPEPCDKYHKTMRLFACFIELMFAGDGKNKKPPL